MDTHATEDEKPADVETADGGWVECTHTGICDRCFTVIYLGAQMLTARAEDRSWEAYCSEECRDSRQAVLAIADEMENTARVLRES